MKNLRSASFGGGVRPFAAALAALTLAAVAPAGAQPADLVRQLLEARSCAGCDLAGAELSDADLAGVNLAGADLAGANLDRADLAGAILVGADLTDASLVNANLGDADLTDANLFRTDLSGARFEDAVVSLVALRAAVICFTWLPNGQMYLLQQNCP